MQILSIGFVIFTNARQVGKLSTILPTMKSLQKTVIYTKVSRNTINTIWGKIHKKSQAEISISESLQKGVFEEINLILELVEYEAKKAEVLWAKPQSLGC